MNARKVFVESHALTVLGLFIAFLGFSGARSAGITGDYLAGWPGIIIGSAGVALIAANIIYLQMPSSNKEEK